MRNIYELPRDVLKKVREETEKAIETGIAHADVEWKLAALETLYSYCKENPEFTVNHIRPIIDGLPVKTHDKRALGGVIRTAVGLGWIEK